MIIRPHTIAPQSSARVASPASPREAESQVATDRACISAASREPAVAPNPSYIDAATRSAPTVESNPTAAALLAAMKPIIRDVYVVQAGTGDTPPILGGRGPGTQRPVPEDLRAFPSHRWVVTPEIEAGHRAHYGARSNAELRADDAFELEPTAGPLLARRYGERRDMTVVELGPATSTVVARTLADNGNRYLATDLSVPLMERQRDLLHEPGFQIAGALNVLGDTYDLPYESGVADVVFTSCHPPFVSSSPAERIQAFGEVARVLKPGGELVLFPFDREALHPAVASFVDASFEIVDRSASNLGSDRQMVVLRKRA